MTPLGYGEELVRETLKNLLKEYGENDGYHFIELDGYNVLAEAICAAQEENKQEEINLAGETLVKHDPLEDDKFDDHAVVAAGPSSGGNIVSAGSEMPSSPMQSEKDVEELMYIPIPPGGSSPPPPPPPLNAATSPPPRRRKPCYGWISDDGDGEEEIEFVMLTPMESSSSGTAIRSPSRGSRWDVRPEDM